MEPLIKQLLEETNLRQGWQIPQELVEYQARVLAKFAEEPKFEPWPSYAEQYMTIRTQAALQHFADVCWFTRAVFPELGQHRGIQPSYYVQLGSAAYQRTQQLLLQEMARHFEFLAETALTAVRYNAGLREMWEL